MISDWFSELYNLVKHISLFILWSKQIFNKAVCTNNKISMPRLLKIKESARSFDDWQTEIPKIYRSQLLVVWSLKAACFIKEAATVIFRV